MRHFLFAFLAIFSSLAVCLPAGTARAGTVDLGISADSISFSDELISGTEIRMYAQITNLGEEDVSGYISFFQGSVPIDDSRVISVRAGGVPEEVFVDFIVPSGVFNIRAEIRGTDPQDQNSANDTVMTRLFTPILDDDRDGVANADDNCPSAANAGQSDADGDGAGDACDEDDDDDGLSDDVESELGTSSTSSDSDGDGVEDPDDAFPTDATKSVIPKPVTAPASVAVPSAAVTPSAAATASLAVSASDAERISEPDALPAEEGEPSETLTPSGLAFSPKAVFLYERLSWNTFGFNSVVPETEGYQYVWDFGDGVTSSRAKVQHTYASSGSFVVTYRVTDPSGQSSEDVAAVDVPFWTLENRVVDLLLGVLALMLLAGMAVVARLFRRQNEALLPPEPTVVSEDEEMDGAASHSVRVRNLDKD